MASSVLGGLNVQGGILVHVSVGGSIAGPPRCPGPISHYLWGGGSWRIDMYI